jgi:hypothetical protein
VLRCSELEAGHFVRAAQVVKSLLIYSKMLAFRDFLCYNFLGTKENKQSTDDIKEEQNMKNIDFRATLTLPDLKDFVYNNEVYCLEDAARDLVETARDWNHWSPSEQWFIDCGMAAELLALCEADRETRCEG